jgi:hypothetical protein
MDYTLIKEIEQWTTHLSKKSIKLLKTLKKESDIKWKDNITPVVPPKPKVYYKRDQNKDQDTKRKKKHRNVKAKRMNGADEHK